MSNSTSLKQPKTYIALINLWTIATSAELNLGAMLQMNDEYELLQNIILEKGNFSQAEQTNEQNISEFAKNV
jgi:hypothetical protein